jgi:hypothetical protein
MGLDVREEMFDGGLAAPDGERTDFYLKYGLVFATGNAIFSVIDCPPEALERLGRWLAAVAKEAEGRAVEEDR